MTTDGTLPSRGAEGTTAEAEWPVGERYGRFCRPKLEDLLHSLRLDVSYEKGSGSYLYYRPAPGEEPIAVLDLVGGFGACLLGHNHPELKRALIEQLEHDAPMLAQSAVRSGAAELAERLNALIPARGRYLCNFTNSGAESIEAALKHAYKVRFDHVRKAFERVARQVHEVCTRIEQEGLSVELPDPRKDLSKFRDDLEEMNLAQLEAFRQAPVVMALKGSFHGKTSGALKVTFNKSYREGYEGLSAIQPVFVDPGELERLPELLREQRIEFMVPRLDGDRLVIERESLSRAIALVFEVVMGEGGIRPLAAAALETLATLHAQLGLPYIVDEVQTGCGRTGAMFAYAQTPLARIEPEYVTLSKALGGGLVKIGVAMIHERVYDPDFGILHTSTFGEDELSCAVACRVLDLLTRDRGALLDQVRDKGAYLIGRLEGLRAKFPQLVKEVRGRGLMIGVEFQALQHLSPLFRYAAKQGFLSLLVASYLLHHHRIRVLAPLTTLLKGNPGKARPAVLRVQPPVTTSAAEMDRFVSALEEVLGVIDANDEYLLLAHLVGEPTDPEVRTRPARMPVIHPLPPRRQDFDARIGFILHPSTLEHVMEFYLRSFSAHPWNRDRVTCWWSELSRFLEPDVAHVAYVESGGFVVEADLVVVPFLPEAMTSAMAAARSNPSPEARQRFAEVQDRIQDAVTVARELGDDHVPTSMVGLGAFTSIVSGQGTLLNDYEVPVTTGNAYTTGLMLQSILRATEVEGLDPAAATCAVVGAAGNIGSVLAALLARHCGHLKLVGREQNDGLARLERVRGDCMLSVLEWARSRLQSGSPPDSTGERHLAAAVARELLWPCLDGEPSRPEQRVLQQVLRGDLPLQPAHGALLDRLVAEHHGSGANPFVSLHVELEAVRDCDVVAVATNSTDSQLIGPETVKPGAIVCSASVPSNLSDAFRDHLQEYLVFDGGFARLPAGNVIDCVGLPSGGLAFGCLSETLLLGFEGQSCSFAKGPIRVGQVEHILDVAQQFGFSLGEFKLAERVHRCPSRPEQRRGVSHGHDDDWRGTGRGPDRGSHLGGGDRPDLPPPPSAPDGDPLRRRTRLCLARL